MESVPATASSAGSSESCSGASPAAVITTKRHDYLKWDDTFMWMAMLAAQRSKDPSTQVGACGGGAAWSRERARGAAVRTTVRCMGGRVRLTPPAQVGACIVDEDNRILSIGYNGMPRGCSDDVLPWAREAPDPLDTKYPYVVHAESNAILNKNSASVKGARLYVGLFPCNECAKLIIQSGIAEVVYATDKYHDTMLCTAARRLFDLAKVKYRRHVPAAATLTLAMSA